MGSGPPPYRLSDGSRSCCTGYRAYIARVPCATAPTRVLSDWSIESSGTWLQTTDP